MPQPGHFTRRNNLVQEAMWDSGVVWMGRENLSPTRIQSPDHPAHSKSLYQLHYPSPRSNLSINWNRKTSTYTHIHTCKQNIFHGHHGQLTNNNKTAFCYCSLHVSLFIISVNIFFYIFEVTNIANHRIINVTICFLFNYLSSDISVFIHYTRVTQQH